MNILNFIMKTAQTSPKSLTFVPGNCGFGYSSSLAGQLNCLAELCCAVCQNFIKIRRTCKNSLSMKDTVRKRQNINLSNTTTNSESTHSMQACCIAAAVL